jgi:SAM-dependent methyltransferase
MNRLIGPEPSDADSDVPYTEDLQDPVQAKAWTDAADRKRPLRVAVRNAIVERFESLPHGARVLELGSGPGFLAELTLHRCPQLASYTLLDFSEAMLDMSRERLGRFPAARFVLGDFRALDWTSHVQPPFEAVVSMQAVHEVRHKRHVPRLYNQIHELLVPGGLFLICDRTPENDSPRGTALFMTENEQLETLRAAGFVGVRSLMAGDAIAFFECRTPR